MPRHHLSGLWKLQQSKSGVGGRSEVISIVQTETELLIHNNLKRTSLPWAQAEGCSAQDGLAITFLDVEAQPLRTPDGEDDIRIAKVEKNGRAIRFEDGETWVMAQAADFSWPALTGIWNNDVIPDSKIQGPISMVQNGEHLLIHTNIRSPDLGWRQAQGSVHNDKVVVSFLRPNGAQVRAVEIGTVNREGGQIEFDKHTWTLRERANGGLGVKPTDGGLSEKPDRYGAAIKYLRDKLSRVPKPPGRYFGWAHAVAEAEKEQKTKPVCTFGRMPQGFGGKHGEDTPHSGNSSGTARRITSTPRSGSDRPRSNHSSPAHSDYSSNAGPEEYQRDPYSQSRWSGRPPRRPRSVSPSRTSRSSKMSGVLDSAAPPRPARPRGSVFDRRQENEEWPETEAHTNRRQSAMGWTPDTFNPNDAAPPVARPAFRVTPSLTPNSKSSHHSRDAVPLRSGRPSSREAVDLSSGVPGKGYEQNPYFQFGGSSMQPPIRSSTGARSSRSGRPGLIGGDPSSVSSQASARPTAGGSRASTANRSARATPRGSTRALGRATYSNNSSKPDHSSVPSTPLSSNYTPRDTVSSSVSRRREQLWRPRASSRPSSYRSTSRSGLIRKPLSQLLSSTPSSKRPNTRGRPGATPRYPTAPIIRSNTQSRTSGGSRQSSTRGRSTPQSDHSYSSSYLSRDGPSAPRPSYRDRRSSFKEPTPLEPRSSDYKPKAAIRHSGLPTRGGSRLMGRRRIMMTAQPTNEHDSVRIAVASDDHDSLKAVRIAFSKFHTKRFGKAPEMAVTTRTSAARPTAAGDLQSTFTQCRRALDRLGASGLPCDYAVSVEHGLVTVGAGDQRFAQDLACIMIKHARTGKMEFAFSQSRHYPLTAAERARREGRDVGSTVSGYYNDRAFAVSRYEQVQLATLQVLSTFQHLK